MKLLFPRIFLDSQQFLLSLCLAWNFHMIYSTILVYSWWAEFCFDVRLIILSKLYNLWRHGNVMTSLFFKKKIKADNRLAILTGSKSCERDCLCPAILLFRGTKVNPAHSGIKARMETNTFPSFLASPSLNLELLSPVCLTEWWMPWDRYYHSHL